MFCLENVMGVGTEQHTGIEHVHKGYTNTEAAGTTESWKLFCVLIFNTD